VVQSLKGIFAIVRKQVCRQIERGKEYNEPECKIPPQQQCNHQVGKRFQVFVYVRVHRFSVYRSGLFQDWFRGSECNVQGYSGSPGLVNFWASHMKLHEI
jgi:hypothetical protein